MAHAIPAKALVVVADGGKAILFRNTGTGGTVALTEEQRLTPADIGQGPSGARPAEQSVKQTDEATFVNQLAHTLHTMHGKGNADAVVLVADPQTLGQLRSALHKSVESSVVHTLAKDYTNMPVAEITKMLDK